MTTTQITPATLTQWAATASVTLQCPDCGTTDLAHMDGQEHRSQRTVWCVATSAADAAELCDGTILEATGPDVCCTTLGGARGEVLRVITVGAACRGGRHHDECSMADN